MYKLFLRKEKYVGYPKIYIDIYQIYLLTNEIPEIAYPIIPDLMDFAGYLQDYDFLYNLYEKGQTLGEDEEETIEIGQALDEHIKKLLFPYSKKLSNEYYNVKTSFNQLIYNELMEKMYDDTQTPLAPQVYKNLSPFDAKIECIDGPIYINRLLSLNSPYFYNMLGSSKIGKTS